MCLKINRFYLNGSCYIRIRRGIHREVYNACRAARAHGTLYAGRQAADAVSADLTGQLVTRTGVHSQFSLCPSVVLTARAARGQGEAPAAGCRDIR